MNRYFKWFVLILFWFNNIATAEFTPLTQAIIDKDIEKASGLIEQGADVNVNQPNAFGITAFMGVCAGLNQGGKDVSLIKQMIELGADVNSRFPNLMVNHKAIGNRTPLMFTVVGGRVDVVQLLIEHGAVARYKNSQGKTALGIARELELDNIITYLENVQKQQ